MRGFIGGLVIGLVIGVVLAVTGPRSGTSGDNSKSESTLNMTYEKATPVRWKLASAFPSKMPFSGSLGPIMIDRLNKISNGNIAIKFHEPGALVASLDLFDAVASGMIDTALSSSQFWGDKSAAFELFGAVPFGPAITSYMAWFREHDGQQLYQELYHRNNIHSLVCGVTGAAGAGWFEHAITDIKDLRNIKIAATGLAARVYRQIGAITVPLAPSDLKNALASKQVDAVAFSTPTADQYLGLMEFSKHYYFPGWFQQTGFIDLMINLEKWNGLSKNQQKIIETACMANIEYSLAAGEASQFEALKNIVTQGVDVKTLPAQVTQGLKKAWLDVARIRAAADKDFSRVLRSLRKFQEDYSIWQELGKI